MKYSQGSIIRRDIGRHETDVEHRSGSTTAKTYLCEPTPVVITPIPQPQKIERLSLQKAYENESLKDITFVLDSGKEFKAHKIILITSDIEYFKILLETNVGKTDPNQMTTILISDCFDIEFKFILDWVYGIKPDYKLIDDNKELYYLFRAADRFICKSIIYSMDIAIDNLDFKIACICQAINFNPNFDDIMEKLFRFPAYQISEILQNFHMAKYEHPNFVIFDYILDHHKSHPDTINIVLINWFGYKDELGEFNHLKCSSITEKIILKADLNRIFNNMTIINKQILERMIKFGYFEAREAIKLFLYNTGWNIEVHKSDDVFSIIVNSC